MLHVIPPREHQSNQAVLDAMFRLRHDVVVDQWGWDIPGAQPGRDIDQFDTDETAYFVAMGDPGTPLEGRALATARLIPTTAPHMMTELFSSFCDLQPSPQLPNVWECSRYLSDAKFIGDKAISRRARIAVNIGMIEFALANDIGRFVWLTHQLMYGLMIKAWVSEPLGLPKRQEGEDDAWIAGISTIDQEALARVSAIYHRLVSPYDPLGTDDLDRQVA